MNIFKLVGELVVIYILYKFIFGFIIPLYQATKQMKGKMSEMQERMQKEQEERAASQKRFEETQQHTSKNAAPAADDYIEYEEIKS
jgi:membrane protein insertase Oxa1/YidC/SpoIIIJ